MFLVALGVDYSIMLMSRLKEERKQYDERMAIAKAVEKTGGVISSAGLILAATFAVLISQPVMELKLFGFAVAVGVLVGYVYRSTVIITCVINNYYEK